MPPPAEDDDWSNLISLLLGKVINMCLGEDTRTVNFTEWKSLKDQVDEWRKSLPGSFQPISPNDNDTAGHSKRSSFPELWLFRGWHGIYIPNFPRATNTSFPSLQLTLTDNVSRRPTILPHSQDHPAPPLRTSLHLHLHIHIPTKRMASNPPDKKYPS